MTGQTKPPLVDGPWPAAARPDGDHFEHCRAAVQPSGHKYISLFDTGVIASMRTRPSRPDLTVTIRPPANVAVGGVSLASVPPPEAA